MTEDLAEDARRVARQLTSVQRKAMVSTRSSVGYVIAAPGTVRALRQRGLLGSTSTTYRILTDLGQAVRAELNRLDA